MKFAIQQTNSSSSRYIRGDSSNTCDAKIEDLKNL